MLRIYHLRIKKDFLRLMYCGLQVDGIKRPLLVATVRVSDYWYLHRIPSNAVTGYLSYLARGSFLEHFCEKLLVFLINARKCYCGEILECDVFSTL